MQKKANKYLFLIGVHTIIGYITMFVPTNFWILGLYYDVISNFISCDELMGIMCASIAFTGIMITIICIIFLPLLLLYKKMGANNRIKIIFWSTVTFFATYFILFFSSSFWQSFGIDILLSLVFAFTLIYTGFFKLFAWKK